MVVWLLWVFIEQWVWKSFWPQLTTSSFNRAARFSEKMNLSVPFSVIFCLENVLKSHFQLETLTKRFCFRHKTISSHTSFITPTDFELIESSNTSAKKNIKKYERSRTVPCVGVGVDLINHLEFPLGPIIHIIMDGWLATGQHLHLQNTTSSMDGSCRAKASQNWVLKFSHYYTKIV